MHARSSRQASSITCVRTPEPNACYSALVFGRGVRSVRRGTIYGASDNFGAYPTADPVSPGDLAATIFWRFGVDPATEIIDSTGRPYRVAEGQPLRQLFGEAWRSPRTGRIRHPTQFAVGIFHCRHAFGIRAWAARRYNSGRRSGVLLHVLRRVPHLELILAL